MIHCALGDKLPQPWPRPMLEALFIAIYSVKICDKKNGSKNLREQIGNL